MARRRSLTPLALLPALLLAAACGSTVPTGGAPTALGGPAGDGLTAPQLDGTTDLAPGPGDPALPGTPTIDGPTPGGTTLTPTGARAPATAGRGPQSLQARGVTATTVTIGAAIPTGTEAAGQALGISGAGSVPELDMWEAVVADVNRTGGVSGRRLVLYNHPIDFAAYVANPEQTYGEVCADFRDDNKVFAAFIYVADPALRACLAKMGSPFLVYGAFTLLPEKAFRDHGGSYLYAPSGLSHERLAELFVDSLVERDFATPWDITNGGPGLTPVKLGLIHADTPDQRNLYAAYARELGTRGLRFADTVTYSGDASTALAATQSAVLRFRSAGITHVFGASAFFLRYAESQRYRPRYAYLPGLGALGAANSPPEQLVGAQTVGWAPMQDVTADQDPGPTAGAARCDATMRKAGLTAGNRQDTKLMYAVCDAVYTFQAASNAGGQPSVANLRRGFESLGTGLRTALTFRATLGPNRHYGVSSVRDMAFQSECSCLAYTSRTDRS